MLAFWILLKDFIVVSRDKQSIIVLIVMPLLLILILGSALSGVVQSSSEEVELTRFNIGVVDEDGSKESKLFIEDILKVRLSSVINVLVLKEEEVDQHFQNDQLSLVLYMTEGFGENIDRHLTPSVKIMTKGDATLERSIVTISLLHYQNIDLAIDQIMSSITRMYIDQAEVTGQSPELSGITARLATLHDGGGRLKETKTEQNTRMGQQTVGSFEYYSVALGVMFMMITVTNLVGRLLTEKEDSVYARQFLTPLTIKDYLLGKFMGLFAVTFVQLCITILGSKLLFKVSWGNSVFEVLYIMIALTISLSALGLVLAAFVNNVQTFTSIGSLGTQLLAALGGSFVPIYVFPEWMVMITKILPNALGIQMFLSLMTGGGFSDIWFEGVLVIALGVVMYTLAWYKFQSKGGGIYV